MRRTFPALLALFCAALLAAGAAQAVPRGKVVKVEPPTPDEKEVQRQQAVKDITVWLPRLVGRFSYDGVVQFFQTARPDAKVLEENAPAGKTYADGTCDEEACQTDIGNVASATGKGDCIAIGTGPGVQCVIYVVWPQEWSPMGKATEGGVSFLGPAATLYGFDPNAATLRYLMLNTNGIAESEYGYLRGDTASWTFETHCESATEDRCRQVIRIRALADGKTIQTSIDIEKLTGGSWARLTSFVIDMHRVPQDQAEAAAQTSPVPQKH